MAETDEILGTHLSLSEARERQQEGIQAAQDSIPESERGNVPTGGIPAVKAWVGDDEGRAQRAMDAEYQRAGGPRDSLVEWLEQRGAVAPSE